MSRSSASAASSSSGSSDRESLWRRSELLPLLLSQVPPHTLTVNFDRHAKKSHAKHEAAGHALGESIPLDKLVQEPLLDWPLDAANPEALWTVAAVDVDDPDRRLSSGEYRTVNLSHASTPPVQKIVWLLLNVPSPQLVKNGHIVAEWEMDVEELKKKQELHRLAFFVFQQKGRVLSNTAVEHSMESKAARQASLAHFIHKHAQIGAQHPHAASFIWVDAQSDEAYARAKHVSDVIKPIESMPKMTHAVKHPQQQFSPPHGPSSALSALSLGEEHGPRGAAPPKEEQKQSQQEEPHGVIEDPVGAMKPNKQP